MAATRSARPCHRAIVQAPRSLPRLIPLPTALGGTGKADFVFLSSVIHAFVDQLFAGMEINGCYQFRVTRNSDLFIDDEDVDDLKHALEGELFESRYGAAVRLETAHDCSDELAAYLLEHFQLSPTDLYQVLGPVNLNRLLAVYDLVDRPGLEVPAVHARRAEAAREHEPVRGDLEARHPAASSVRVVRAGDRLRLPRGERPRRARDQADALPHDARLAARRKPRLGREGGQGSDGADRAARAIRRGRQHRAREQAAGSRRACRLRRRRLQDALQDGARRAARGRPAQALRPPRHRQLPSAYGARLHRLRTVVGQRGARRRRAPGFHAAHEPHEDAAAQAAFAVAVQSARTAARDDSARDAQRERRQDGADHREDQRARGARGHSRALRGFERRV